MKKKCIKLLLISTFLLGADTTHGAADESGERRRGTSTIRGSEMRTALVVFKGCLARAGVIDSRLAKDPDYAPGAEQGQQLVKKFESLGSELQATRQGAADRLGELQALLDSERAAEAESRARLEAVTAEARAAEARAASAEVKIRRMMAQLREVEARNRRLIPGILETAAAADARRRLARGDICESRKGCFGGVPVAVALQRTPQKLATQAAIKAYLQQQEEDSRTFDVRPMASLDDADLDTSTTVVPGERTDLAGGTGGSVLGDVDERVAASPARGPRSEDKPLLKPTGSSSR